MRELLAQRTLCPRDKPGIVALSHHILKRFDGSWVERLKPDLVSRYTADSWTGVTQHAFNKRSQNVDGQWVRLAFLTPNSMDGMPAHEWRCIPERPFERLTATLIAEVIH